MRTLVIDFETAWSRKDGYSLSCMTNEEYVRDPRFKAWGLCWKALESPEPAVWVTHDELQEWADGIDWEHTAVMAHNAQFDISCLSWHYGAKPAFIIDTLSMARALRGLEVGNSLAKLAEAFELPPKGNAVYSTDGILDALPEEVERELANYCSHDTWLCEQIFLRLLPNFPAKELRVVDLTLKMYTDARLLLDKEMLRKAIYEEDKSRNGLLMRLGIEESVLASNQQFAALLEDMGVPVPMKTSKTTGKPTFALAKNDAVFQSLLNGDDENLVQLCEARLKVKSAMERTRAQRFLDIAERGPLPVPLSYYAALSGRWGASRGSAINMQNLKRGSFLRKAIMAPDGYMVGVGDLSQIEARTLAMLAGFDSLLDIFRGGGDAYATFGATMFGIPGMTKKTHPVERQSAKSALLGAGYQLGWASFAAQLLVGFLGADPIRYTREHARKLGVTARDVERFMDWDDNLVQLGNIPHVCTDEELIVHCLVAKAIIDSYRANAPEIVKLWGLFQELIEVSLYGGAEHEHKCLLFRKGEIILPNGMPIRYPGLEPGKDKKGRRSWSYIHGNKRTGLYGGKVTNNANQGLARVVMSDGMLRIYKRYHVAGTVHDEIIFLPPAATAESALDWVLEQMTIEPTYLPGIPLAAEGGVHLRYGEAKQ